MIDRAVSIIENIEYLTVASICPDGTPWNTPVFTSYDSDLNFYWGSYKENQHSLNILNNGLVFCVLYDSRAKEGTGEGLYLKGYAEQIDELDQIEQGLLSAGLKVKLPFPIQNVRYFDKRILEVDPAPRRVNISSDSNSPLLKGDDVDVALIEEVSGEPIIVDTFARYKITDPLLFLKRLQTEARARQQIENVMDSATRDVLGGSTLREILSPARGDLMVRIRDRVNMEMEPRGVEIVDIRIVRADLTERGFLFQNLPHFLVILFQ